MFEYFDPFKIENTIISSNQDKIKSQLQAILYLLQTSLEDFKNEVDRSYDLLKIGEKTDLSKKLENTLENPVQEFLEISNSTTQKVKQLLAKVVRNYLMQNEALIDSAYRTQTPNHDLHYCIVLKEDIVDNRMTILNFFEFYDMFDYSHNYPIYFQLVPKH